MDSVASFHHALALALREHPDHVPRDAEGPRGLHLYTELVFRQKELLVRSLFPNLCRALRALPLSFRHLVFEYATHYPPKSAYPNDWLEHFADYLGSCREKEGPSTYPSYLEELADFEFLCHQVTRFTPDHGIGLHRTLHVRHYAHDILAFTEGGIAAPVLGPSTVVVYLHRTLLQRRFFRATHADVVAIARASGVDVGAPSLNDALLQRAGVLP